MTETERKALALVKAHGGHYGPALEAAIEQHEAFRQEVSDAVEAYWDQLALGHSFPFYGPLARFIIAKPDPLVEALNDMKDGRAGPTTESYAACLRAALAARGLEIREVGHD